MASALDAEIAKFRQLQQDVTQLHSDLQILTGQATKNEMVLQELHLLQAEQEQAVQKIASTR
jgi:hypothetical protein